MKNRLLSILFLTFTLSAGAQTMGKLFGEMPDSIIPQLTKNNRLDCVDFLESNMQARVRNVFDDYVEMTKLTPTYLHITMSELSSVEMSLLSDSIICLVRTVKAPAADSHVEFFDAHWHALTDMQLPSIEVSDYWQEVPDSLSETARYAQRSLADLPLVEVTLDEAEPILTLTMQCSELHDDELKLARQYMKPIRFRWRQGWERE